jgi:hypothetical protein
MKMNVAKKILFLAGASFLAACSSVMPVVYVPQQSGTLNDSSVSGNISVTLKPDQADIRRGEPLGFSVTMQNVSLQTILLPRQPDVVLTWIYPDGKRDNLIRDTDSLQANPEFVKLAPGAQIVSRLSIKTSSFHRAGIFEFRAIVSAAGADKTWAGCAVSNGFGVMVE